MFKKITFLAVLALGMSYSCQTDNEFEELQTNSYKFNVTTKDLSNLSSRDEESVCYSTPLIAGQNDVVGRVNVEMVNEYGIDYVYITYTTNDDWVIKLTHLYAGSRENIPETVAGNPMPGVFEEEMDFEANVNSDFEVEYKIEAEAFEECFYIAAHAEVAKIDKKGDIIEAETAWGDGEDFDGNNWAMYFQFCKDSCDSNESINTGDNDDEDHHNCDSDHDDEDHGDRGHDGDECDDDEGDHHNCDSDHDDEDHDGDECDNDEGDHHNCDSDHDDEDHGDRGHDGDECDDDEGDHHNCDSDRDDEDHGNGDHDEDEEDHGDGSCNNDGTTGGGTTGGGTTGGGTTGGGTTGGGTTSGGTIVVAGGER